MSIENQFTLFAAALATVRSKNREAVKTSTDVIAMLAFTAE
jgi:hypothetical protein